MKKFLAYSLIQGACCAALANVDIAVADFDAGYVPGNLAGQNGWFANAQADVSQVGTWPFVVSNPHSVKVDTSLFTANSRYLWREFPTTFTLADYLANPVLHCAVSVYMTDGTPSWFGIDAWANEGANRHLGLQIRTGDIDFFDRSLNAGAGAWVTTPDPAITNNRWHHLEIFADFVTNKTWALVNGRILGATGNLTFDNINELDMYTFRPTGSNNVGYYDNYAARAVIPSFDVMVSSVTATEGSEFQGDRFSMDSSDNSRYEVFNDENTLAATVRLDGTAPPIVPTELRFTLESSVARPGLSQLIRMRNYSSGGNPVVDGRVATLSDTSVTVVLNSSATSYVGPNRELEATVNWAPINDEDPSQDGWIHAIDLAKWTVIR